MQIEGTKLIFIMNISVLYFIKFASRMPQIAQILVSPFKIFRGSMPPDPPRNFLFFFFFFLEQFQALIIPRDKSVNMLPFTAVFLHYYH